MKRTSIASLLAAAALCLAYAHRASAQAAPSGTVSVRRVSLAEGLRLLQENNLELRIARQQVAAAAALRVSAGAFPNPTVSAVREQLGGTPDDYSETVVALAQLLEVGGQRGLRREAAARVEEALDAQLAAEGQSLAFDLHRAYVRAAQAEADLAAGSEVVAEFRKVEAAGRVRFAEGDISRFDTRRLHFERARYETLVAEAGLRLSEAGRALARLADPDAVASGVLVLPSEALTRVAAAAVGMELSEALAAADERPELRAADARVEAARAALSLQLRERIPDLTLTGGYKHQTDGRTGAVVGFALPLPLWNRHAGEVAAARSEHEVALSRRDLVRLQIESEIRGAWERYRSYRERMPLLADELLPESAGLLESARVAYELGEMSLLELLDAADVYRTSRETLHQLLADALIARYDLDRAMGRLVLTPGLEASDASPRQEDR